MIYGDPKTFGLKAWRARTWCDKTEEMSSKGRIIMMMDEE